MRTQQMVGRVFARGDIKVVALKGRDSSGHQLVEFECRRKSTERGKICGNRHVCRFSKLKSGEQTSCGCGKRERTRQLLERLAERILNRHGIRGHWAIAKSSNRDGYTPAAKEHNLGKLGRYLASTITAKVRKLNEEENRRFLKVCGDLEPELTAAIARAATGSAFGEPYRHAGTFTPKELGIKRDKSLSGEFAHLYLTVELALAMLERIHKKNATTERIANLIGEFQDVVIATIEHRKEIRKRHGREQAPNAQKTSQGTARIAKPVHQGECGVFPEPGDPPSWILEDQQI